MREENNWGFDIKNQSQVPPRTYDLNSSKRNRRNNEVLQEIGKQKIVKQEIGKQEIVRPKSRRKSRREQRRKRRNRILRRFFILFLIIIIGFIGIYYFIFNKKPYTIAIDPGHGGNDIGAEGIIDEVELIDPTVKELIRLLEDDGRFRVVISRDEGEGMSIEKRNKKFQRADPDIVISIHGNASSDEEAFGFECFPAPPGSTNHEESMKFASFVTAEMGELRARLRGVTGIRFGYYVPDSDGAEEYTKLIVDSADTTIYDYETFGILKNMDCPTLLVEQGFVTNESDVERFAGDEGTKKSAKAYYNAIINYLENIE